MQKHPHARRGLASVVTGAIMLTAVALMGTGVVSWSNTNLFAHQQSLQSTYSTSINKINEDLKIENVWFGNPPLFAQKFLNITMSNLGNIGVNVTKIELINSTHSIAYQLNDGEILPKKSYSKLITNEWGNGALIDVVVTTERDSIFRTQVLPP
jgi:archaellum component FlaF (FlaF/FlaG flagellin family)